MDELQHAINAIRVNGISAVNQAKSGHPGIVLGASPTLVTLFANHMNYLPDQPDYFNRDRFVLSAGHGSAMLYALLCAMQVKSWNIADLKNFRQLHSQYAGHPERDFIGIEVNTGPLGQGVANAVGLALAEARLASLYQVNDQSVVDHYTYCMFGDGCMQEGIFHEALSIAAYYNLHKLILIYDSNDIQLDGPTKNSEILDHEKYFAALNFDYHLVCDGEDIAAIDQAIAKAKQTNRPSIIEVKSVIGIHSNKANSSSVHGAPLNQTEIDGVRAQLHYFEPEFTYDQKVYQAFKNLQTRSAAHQLAFNNRWQQLVAINAEAAAQLEKLVAHQYDMSFLSTIKSLQFSHEASRNIVGQVYQHVVKNNPTITTLNADLSGSTKIIHQKQPWASSTNHAAPNWNVGVRELAMQAINNGISAHGGVLGVGSTFGAFADYTKPALRVGAISKLNTLTVFSHDSITVGEDGPTHQPIEQLWSLRLTPNVYVARPTNVSETAVAFELWLHQNAHSPVVISSSRATFDVYEATIQQARYGGYVIYQTAKTPTYDICLVATGSEVSLAVEVAKLLHQHQLDVKVVSAWCLELFMNQKASYIKQTLSATKLAVSIEFGASGAWNNLVDLVIGIDQYGLSAKPEDIIKHLGLTPEAISQKILAHLPTK